MNEYERQREAYRRAKELEPIRNRYQRVESSPPPKKKEDSASKKK